MVKKNIKYNDLSQIIIISLGLAFFIIINLIMLFIPYFFFFGITKPELWLIPIGIVSLQVKFSYRIILVFLCILANFIFIPFTLIILTPWSIIFDYSLPYLIFTLMFLINKKKQYWYYFIIILLINLLVYSSHFISGYIFFTAGKNSTMPANYSGTRIEFSLIYNLIYLPPTLILSLIIIPLMKQHIERKNGRNKIKN